MSRTTALLGSLLLLLAAGPVLPNPPGGRTSVIPDATPAGSVQPALQAARPLPGEERISFQTWSRRKIDVY